MKKISLLAIALVFLITTGCSKNISDSNINNSTINQTVASDFNFVFRYGVTGKNELNTINGTFTKDLITDGTATTSLVLSDAELASIQQKISDLHLFNQPSVNNANASITVVTPCTSYYVQVQNGTMQQLSWDDCDGTMTLSEQKFVDYMISLIQNRSEYQTLPEATGGYM